MKDKTIVYKSIYVLGGLILVFLYREILEPNIFSNYYHRDNKSNIFDLSRYVFLFNRIISLLFVGLPYSIYKGIRAIIFYSIQDWIFLIVFLYINFRVIFYHKIKKMKPNKSLNIICRRKYFRVCNIRNLFL